MSDIKTGLDTAMLASLNELLGEKFVELIDTYIEDSRARLQRLSDAVSISNFDVMRQEGHGMKGSSRNIGANGFAELCGQMEACGRDHLAGAEQLLSAIEQSFAALCDELKAYL